MPSVKRACLAAAILFPMAARGSFGGGSCTADFACHFLTWGLLVGTVALPISGVIFAVLHLAFGDGARSKAWRIVVGGVIGIFAYEAATFFGALIASLGRVPDGKNGDYMVMASASAYVVLAIVSVLHARSNPRDHVDD